MRPVLFLLSLIAALFGSPLRQAEAANDLGRSLAELDSGAANLEDVDGGVGDDAGDTIRTDESHALECDTIADALPAPTILAAELPVSSPHVRIDRATVARVYSSRRFALLQRFLF